eukprot:TRINITY_DN341_c0_g1_i1.p1 TRINITY_DN341_c0_g1~~TRINITY_DN341_c0_g1_i1.p1  ORF type:complete len:469 (+),score=208.91 TRINITY_DN341_c0_g1_i1:500-1906(+)
MPKVIRGGNSKFDQERKNESISKTIEKKKSNDQFSFGKKLASVDKTIRDRGVNNLSKWMIKKEEMTQVEFLKVWKALYYCYWLSDKPIVQFELADQLTDLVLKFEDNQKPIHFIQAFYATLKREWAGIDYLRIDKYLKFIRQMLNKSLQFLKSRNWDAELIREYNQILPISDDAENIGLQLHLILIYPEEIYAIDSDLDSSIVSLLLEPFLPILQSTNHEVLRKNIVTLYEYLLTRWRKGRERTEYDEEEGDLPYILVNYEEVLTDLNQICKAKETPAKNRSMCYKLKELAEQVIKEEQIRKEEEEKEKKQLKSAPKKKSVKRKTIEVEEEAKEQTPKVTLKKTKKATVPAQKLLQELEHQVIPLDEVEKKKEAEEHPKANGKSKPKEEEPQVSASKKKNLVWNLEKNKAQEFEDASNIHPVSPAIRNKNAKAKSILRAEPSPMKPNVDIKVPVPVPKRAIRGAGKRR